MKAAFIGTYVPRRCGIATFTCDLAGSVERELKRPQMGDGSSRRGEVIICALTDPSAGINYGSRVGLEIPQQDPESYIEAAEYLNLSGADVVCFQHEYGIYGGGDGEYVLILARRLRRPLVTTLHTVLERPTPGQQRVLEELCAHSDAVAVMSERSCTVLMESYRVPRRKIRLIHHGVPDVPFGDPNEHKGRLDAAGREVLLTFGLLGPNKGIETAIEAVGRVVDRCPNLLYIVLGQTHPELKRRSGEAYRQSLEALVRERGLENHVRFHNRYVSLENLCDALCAADIYVTPYLSREQAVSGTLAYAVGAGCAVVSTPYSYAQEMAADGRGLLFDFGDAEGLARHLDRLLGDSEYRRTLRAAAYAFGRSMIWKEVAKEYVRTFAEAASAYSRRTIAVPLRPDEPVPVPQPNLTHLRRLTDPTGVLQHALYSMPNRSQGYCSDDNARAAVLCATLQRVGGDGAADDLLRVYLSFLAHAQREDGLFRNFLSYDRKWLDDRGSDDTQGRALWALGAVVAAANDGAVMAMAKEKFERALPGLRRIYSLRSRGTAALGCALYLERFPGAHQPREMLTSIGQSLARAYADNHDGDWDWPEPVVTYDNAMIPAGLLAAAGVCGRDDWARVGRAMLEFLIRLQARSDRLSIIGNRGWLTRGGSPARFDQQPLDAAALAEAAAQAISVLGEATGRDLMRLSLNWYLGHNDLGVAVGDTDTGACGDGLTPVGVNANQGAESTISFLYTLCRAQEFIEGSAEARTRQGEASSIRWPAA